MVYWKGFRRPKTTNERRLYYRSPELVRAGRRPLHLPNSWDDLDRCLQRSWKEQGKKRRQHGYDQKYLCRIKYDMES